MEENKETFEECINRINRKIKMRRIKNVRMRRRFVSLEDFAEIIKIELSKKGEIKGTLDLEIGEHILGKGVKVVRKYNFLRYNVTQSAGPYDDRFQAKEEAFDDALSTLRYLVKPCLVERVGSNQVCVVSPQKHYWDSE